MHPDIEASPDIVLRGKRVAIFIHGCFWHKCPKCFRWPKTREEYWKPKIDRNVERDRENREILKKNGWEVLEIWEHEIKNDFQKVLDQIINIYEGG